MVGRSNATHNEGGGRAKLVSGTSHKPSGRCVDESTDGCLLFNESQEVGIEAEGICSGWHGEETKGLCVVAPPPTTDGRV